MSNGETGKSTELSTAELTRLVERLRGKYRIPITDGLGAVGGGDEPDNPDEFVRTFQTSPIMHEAADVIERLQNVDQRSLRTDSRISVGHHLEIALYAAYEYGKTCERESTPYPESTQRMHQIKERWKGEIDSYIASRRNVRPSALAEETESLRAQVEALKQRNEDLQMIALNAWNAAKYNDEEQGYVEMQFQSFWTRFEAALSKQGED